jgi:hypothetical protein
VDDYYHESDVNQLKYYHTNIQAGYELSVAQVIVLRIIITLGDYFN